MKVWGLGNCENIVGKREELVFDAFIPTSLILSQWKNKNGDHLAILD